MRFTLVPIAPVLALAALAAPAHATFHFMQIEQLIGGVGGDPTKQAIQLRMRFGSQNFVNNVQIKVFDATGANPVTILTCDRNVAVGTTGARILIASPNFLASTSPACVPDFTMTNLIPASYLAGGRMTWESGNIIYWSVAWGNYTGPNTGVTTNDANGNFGAPFPSPLPSVDDRALRFTGTAGALSTTNIDQYALTPAAAVFTNNANVGFTVVAPPPPCPQDFNDDGDVNGDDLADYINCFFSAPPCEAADFNDDGDTNGDDLADYINAFFGPAC